ncbi:MAG: ABC transporter ATP-binding protein [Chloroflexi bacterium]|nr:ABC transporter ATP-binding protein [Chloroflexota bacterium]MYD64946.1 ABC transporter ATP-binding protein [Chloroflexota bacterium]
MATLTVRELTHGYEAARRVVDGVSFEVADGRVAALLGPSGSGKTTILRLIAGLERPEGGDVQLDGASVLGRAPHRRGVGLMFQELALFPHLDVRANVAFGLRMARWPRDRRERRVDELLALVGIEALGGRRVDALSGGERQRVGLARALAPEPAVLLLDEPLGALDEARKRELRRELRGLLERLETTALLVSHDLRDAQALADDLVALDAGRVLQAGSLHTVLAEPASPEVASMVGWVRLVEGDARDGRVEESGVGSVAVPEPLEGPVLVMAHPSAMTAVPTGDARDSGARGTVVGAQPEGPLRVLEVAIGALSAVRYVEVRWDARDEPPAPGSPVALAVDPATLRCYRR